MNDIAVFQQVEQFGVYSALQLIGFDNEKSKNSQSTMFLTEIDISVTEVDQTAVSLIIRPKNKYILLTEVIISFL